MNSNWIKNKDGSIYHLGVKQEDLATTILTVGDPNRVAMISKHFDTIEFRNSSREFVCHTGRIGSKMLTVISTGIGTDNIDIVINELDAAFNINLDTGEAKEKITQLDFIRIGTSGTIQKDIPIDSILVSKYAIGTDALYNFYEHNDKFESDQILLEIQRNGIPLPSAYLTTANSDLLQIFSDDLILPGLTITAPGFYAPQGRITRINASIPDLLLKYSMIQFPNLGRITNIEMETSGIYALSKSLGHRAISLNAILANRISNEFSKNPERTIEKMIDTVLTKLNS